MIFILKPLNNNNNKPNIQFTNGVVNCVCDTKLCNEKLEYLEGYSNAIFEIESFDGFYNHYYSDNSNNVQFQR